MHFPDTSSALWMHHYQYLPARQRASTSTTTTTTANFANLNLGSILLSQYSFVGVLSCTNLYVFKERTNSNDVTKTKRQQKWFVLQSPPRISFLSFFHYLPFLRPLLLTPTARNGCGLYSLVYIYIQGRPALFASFTGSNLPVEWSITLFLVPYLFFFFLHSCLLSPPWPPHEREHSFSSKHACSRLVDFSAVCFRCKYSSISEIRQ